MSSAGSVRVAFGAGLVASATGALLAACAAVTGLDHYSVEDCPWGCDASWSTEDASIRGEAASPSGDAGDATMPDDAASPEQGQDGANDAGLDDSPLEDAASSDGAEAGCPTGFLACEAGCVSPADPLNCGRCGNACTVESGTPSCQPLPDTNTYVCVSGCPAATPTLCGSACVDTRTDPGHCGACDVACSASAPNTHSVCGDGGCSLACDTGYSLCNGACVLYTTAANCGGCGVTCDADGGYPLCALPSGPGADGGPYACASGCPSASPTRCNGACVDTTSDTANCGTCANACTTGVANAQPVCTSSTCSFACNPGYASCGGACVDFTSDPLNCGGCGVGHVCGSNQVCLSGVCTTRCRATNDCPAGFACNGSTCTSSCNANQPCHGGCCSAGTCTSGLSASACGTGGGLCTNCSVQSANTACVSGVCGCNVAADCPALNACSTALHTCQGLCGGANTGCNGGCCTNLASGGTCVAGSSDTQCGGTGGQCNDCQTGCNPGPKCINNACGCGPGTLDCAASASACSAQGLTCSDAGACQK